jgi:hypothetical protein
MSHLQTAQALHARSLAPLVNPRGFGMTHTDGNSGSFPSILLLVVLTSA